MTIEKDNGAAQIVALRNVKLFLQLVERVKAAPTYSPNWGCFYGLSGYGKTTAAAHAGLTSLAVYLECGSTWSKGSLVKAIAHELNLDKQRGALSDRVLEIIDVLSDDPRPIIIDEADHLVKKSLIDVVREIADKSHAPVILIGEQTLPKAMLGFERAHNRVLAWTEAQPCTFEEAKLLLKRYAAGVEISPDLLKQIVEDTLGVTRRIVTNLDNVREFAMRDGLTKVDLKDYVQEHEIYKGVPQSRRAARGKAVAA